MSDCLKAPHHWVVHDYLQVHGGAERLVLILARGLPGWGLAVSGVYPAFARSADLHGVHAVVLTQWLRLWPRVLRALLTFYFPIKLLRTAQTVVYSGIYAPLAVRHQRVGLKAMYCHTPPRFAFDRQEQYVGRSPLLFRPLLRLGIALYRRAYLQSLAKMDLILTNSEHVRQRLRTLTGFDSKVIYPPIATAQFKWQGTGDYYLSLGRLERLKRVDRIVQAFLAMPDKKLVVASGGSEQMRLLALAQGAPNIEFTDWLDDRQLQQKLGHAIATLYIPEDEDFGMSAVESMAAGKPVITVAQGGLLETQIDGKTGLLLPPNPSPQDIAQAVQWLTPERALAMRTACEQRASEFTIDQFLDAFQRSIHLAVGRSE